MFLMITNVDLNIKCVRVSVFHWDNNIVKCKIVRCSRDKEFTVF